MAFDPISWAIGFGATQVAKTLLEHFDGGLRSNLRNVAANWSKSLPVEIYTPPEVVFHDNGSGPARERLQLKLILHNQVPDESFWYDALFEAWEERAAALGEDGNEFLRQSPEDASEHLNELAAALSLACKKQSELFQVSALHHLDELLCSTKNIERDVGKILKLYAGSEPEPGETSADASLILPLDWDPYLEQAAEYIEGDLEAWEGGQQGANRNSADIGSILDGKLFQVYVRVYQGLPPEERMSFRDEQSGWMQKRYKGSSDAVESHGGSLAPLEFNLAFIEFTKERIKELESRLPTSGG